MAISRRILVATGWLRRGYADLGPNRKDYADPCFERNGFVHESFFGHTVKMKTSNRDQRFVIGSPEFYSYSWTTDSRSRILERKRMKLAGIKVKDKSGLLLENNKEETSSLDKEETAEEQDVGISSVTGDSLEAIARYRQQNESIKTKPKKRLSGKTKQLL